MTSTEVETLITELLTKRGVPGAEANAAAIVDVLNPEIDCPECDGKGFIPWYPDGKRVEDECEECNGTGKTRYWIVSNREE